MSPPRTVLLVGEGNFSFSASLCQQLSSAATSITATCLQSEDEALRHQGAADNIEIINKSGGSVLYEVDCRQLGGCSTLRGRLFDRVVFNFPHCGRKSGVKKNRELLKDFFHSCVQVLADDGEVHVSLCNGQGGTPADHPRREWHNSWQVAAMAAEAHLILTDVQPFESEKFHSYKCTGYRSQDKGFHVENALLHVFTRSLPYTTPQVLTVEETVVEEKVKYNVPTELSDYVFRDFLCSGSTHPVRLVQDLLFKGLTDNWLVSMMTETTPLLLTAKELQGHCHHINTLQCYSIQLLQKDLKHDPETSKESERDSLCLNSQECKDARTATCASSGKEEAVKSKETSNSKLSRSPEVDPEGESSVYVLRPSLLPQMEDLLNKKEELPFNNRGQEDGEENSESDKDEGHRNEGVCGVRNGDSSLLQLFGMSGLVFRNVSINLWALPCFHELLFRGVFPSDSKPVMLLGQHLERLLAPHGVTVAAKEDVCLTAQPMGVVGRVFASNASEKAKQVTVNVSLNLDLLAVLMFSIPDWRLLWSHDPHFLKQFALCPSPGKAFQPFSLFPEHIRFDISFWTGSSWEEKRFHALVREASHGTAQQVKLIDRFSHPDLSQTSYCYRLTYHSHTHALSHTQALQFHKQLEVFLSSRLQVTIR